MINDHLSSLNGRLLRPALLAIEPALVPFSQAFGSARRGASLAVHCSWALFASAEATGQSAGALFSDIRSAYYNVIRQLVFGTAESDDALLVIFHRLQLGPETCAEVLQFVHAKSSILAQGGASEELVDLLRALNEQTWFVVDGADVVTQSLKGARPGETIADLVFIFCSPKLPRKSGLY
jgi:hypothetical protein